MHRNDNIIVEIGCMIALRHFLIPNVRGILNLKITLNRIKSDHIKKMSQSDHTTNFHNYVIISAHIHLYFVSVAQFFAKLILSVAQFLYHKVFRLGHKI